MHPRLRRATSVTLVSLVFLACVLGNQAAHAALGDQLHKLTAVPRGAQDLYGFSSAVSGNVAIVGARFDDDAGSNSGSAYLVDMTTGNQLFKLTASDAAAEDWFGHSVAISGNVAIVGSPQDDDAGSLSGSAYLFNVTTGAQLFKLTPADAAGSDQFGFSVGISGNVAVIGAKSDETGGIFSGSSYLFDVTTGLQISKFVPVGAAAGDRIGGSVGIDGNTAIIGSDGDDDLGSTSGSAYIIDVTTGSLIQKLLAGDGVGGDGFGISVAISGNTAIVGANFDDDAGINSGSAYLFNATTGSQIAKLTALDDATLDEFGKSVSISGNTAIVGAFFHDDAGSNSGSAYLFDATTGTQLSELAALDAEPGDRFGFSVGISGNTAIVGAEREGSGAQIEAGAAYVFDASASTSTDVTFRLEDQSAVEISGSTFFVDPGGITVPTGGTITLSPGVYTLRLQPGLGAQTGSSGLLYRQQSLTVSGGSQAATFEWKTADLTVTVVDQSATPIPNSTWAVDGGFPTSANGTSVTIPVTEDPLFPTMFGTRANGHQVRVQPGLGAQLGSQGLLYRVETVPEHRSDLRMDDSRSHRDGRGSERYPHPKLDLGCRGWIFDYR